MFAARCPGPRPPAPDPPPPASPGVLATVNWRMASIRGSWFTCAVINSRMCRAGAQSFSTRFRSVNHKVSKASCWSLSEDGWGPGATGGSSPRDTHPPSRGQSGAIAGLAGGGGGEVPSGTPEGGEAGVSRGGLRSHSAASRFRSECQSLPQAVCGIQTGLRLGRALGPGLEGTGTASVPPPTVCTQTRDCPQVWGALGGGDLCSRRKRTPGRSRDRQPLSQAGLRTGVHTPPAPRCPSAKPRPRAVTLPHRAPESEFQAPSCSPPQAFCLTVTPPRTSRHPSQDSGICPQNEFNFLWVLVSVSTGCRDKRPQHLRLTASWA